MSSIKQDLEVKNLITYISIGRMNLKITTLNKQEKSIEINVVKR